MVAPLAAAHVCAMGSTSVGGAVAAALHFFAVAQCMLHEPWPEQPKVFNESHFDFIVVGGGTAGSVLAARLAQLRDVTVLLLEAGPDPPTDSTIPAYKDLLKSGPYDWNFTSLTDGHSGTALKGGIQRQPRGRMLGGSASANDMIYTRGFPKDFQKWAEIAGPSWDWDTVLSYYKKTEHLTDEKILNDPVLMAYHSVHGEMVVSGTKHPAKEVEMFLKAFNEVGFDLVNDMTYPGKFGAGRFLHTIREGRRESTATAFINRNRSKSKNQGNLFVLRNALATQVLINANKTAYGVKVLRDGKHEHVYYSDFEVVLTAGAFNTPKLLILSGVGPKKQMTDLGIPLVQELPVGETLHDHAMVLTYIIANGSLCSQSKSEQHMEMIKYLHDQTGALSSSDSMGVYLTLDASSNSTVPDFGIYPVCIPKNSGFKEACGSILNFRDSVCEKLGAVNKEHELLSFAVVNLDPKSRGKVRLVTKDPLENPIVHSGTFSDPADFEGYHEVLGIVYSLLNTTYLKKKGARVVDLELEECVDKVGDEEIRKCYAKAVGTSAWRSAGTAALGAVLEADLRVRGVGGLRVADASAMPTGVRGNINAPVVMIAERAFDFIKERLKDLSYNFLV
ncbi:unnamed protein product [Chilo suppressalis]|uniref:Glucose-methanol-choline oxidoreductase N-terminal domain-containing protein n=1 Tax=Chilo suppressalis TaxID=168631 RepID=A0ABN8AW78_CHISP|nr:unnamed protein product [Chilo suppressalis]